MDGCVLSANKDHSTDIRESVHTAIDDKGRSWVVIPDELWDQRETCEYQFGYPIYVTQYRH